MLEIRQILCQALDEIMATDEKAIVIDADLAIANGTVELGKKYPKRAIDAGICEAQMVGLAAGLSAYGFKPYIISFTPFVTRRIVDQITISGCYAKQNIKVIGTDSGVAAQTNGGTHMSFEDIGIMRSVPEMRVFEPTDGLQLKQLFPVVHQEKGCMYIRIVRKLMEPIFADDYQFELNKIERILEGKDVTLVTSGLMVAEGKKAAEELRSNGISVELLAVHMIKPIAKQALIDSAKKTNLVVTVDNHNIYGGLFSAVSEVLSQYCPTKVIPLGIKNHFGEVGDMQFLMDKYGISAKHIVEAVEVALKQ